MLRIISLSLLVLISIFGCNEKQKNNASTEETVSSALDRNLKKTDFVNIAPFDRFPTTDKFPLRFRFSQPVAPPNKTARDNFSLISITPAIYGTWKWESDSELLFEPKEKWKSGENFSVSLDGLKIFGNADNLKEKINFRIPIFEAHITRCELVVKSKAPLIQFPVINLRSNFPIQLKNLDSMLEFYQAAGGKTEKITYKTALTENGFNLEITGHDLFRPEADGEVVFYLRKRFSDGTGKTLEEKLNCKIPVTIKNWDDKLNIVEIKEADLPITSIKVDPPRRPIGYEGDGRMPLTVSFLESWSTIPVSHGKPSGIKIEQGISIEPPIMGTWKSSEYSDNVLEFTPDSEWPIGQNYLIEFDQHVFPKVKFKDLGVGFQSPLLNSEIENLELLSNPNNSTQRQIYASLKFTHPPDTNSLKKFVSLIYRIEPEKNFKNSLGFDLSIDNKTPNIVNFKSDYIELPQEPGEALLAVNAGAVGKLGGLPTQKITSKSIKIPSQKEVFKIETISVSILNKDENNIQRVLSVDSSEALSPQNLLENLQTYLLPDCKLKSNKKICRGLTKFGSESLITKEVLDASTKVSLTSSPRDESVLPKLFHFTFESEGNREVFAVVKSTLISDTGFKLAEDYRKVLNIKQLPKSVKIMHSGSLLSITGSKKLGIALRGTNRIEYELSRILPHDLHHLISVTSGGFARPNFDSYQVSLNQLSEKFKYLETIPEHDPGKTYFTSIDFSRFQSQGSKPQGLFVLNVREKEDQKAVDNSYSESINDCESEDCDYSSEAENSSLESRNDSRMVLLTNLGILVKDNLAGEHTVFVVSFKTGLPVAGASVKLLGQNGIPIFTKISDENGEVVFPSTVDFRDEKLPLVYVVEKDSDYSFLPFGNTERQMNFSRFETGGIFNSDEAEGLRAMIFSDRGIYRPGEEARFGIIVRKRNLEVASDKLPVELSLRDPRGIEILRKKYPLSSEGFNDFRWVSENALTGTYTLGIYLVRGAEEYKHFLLGSTSFRVDEFQPDKLISKSFYETTPINGVENDKPQFWKNGNGEFEVEVLNLFGTPAVGNKVKGSLLVRPWDGVLDLFPDYRFYAVGKNSNFTYQPEDLGEQVTDSQGKVTFRPDLSKYSEAAFELDFASEAFEKESGRSVVSTTKNLVSTSQYFVGWKADGDLSFIHRDGQRKVSFLVVNPQGEIIDLKNSILTIEQTTMVSALIKQPNGALKYQMTPKVIKISEEKIDIPRGDFDIPLKTDVAGEFKLSVKNESGQNLAEVIYQVHGEGNTTFMADRTSEVGIRLNKTNFEPHDEIEVSINTPYVGTGLLTIERDKIYSRKWFKVDTLSSVQKIKVPQGIIGNAYISVSFVRALDSKEIFSSPLSYGVKPFSIARSEYTSKLTLDVPAKVKPGENLEVKYQINESGKFLLYAVDEGILKFAKYKNPEPISNFVPKRALEVETYQILDLLLPDHKLVEAMSSPGGDEDVSLGKFKNPFSRKKRAPMAFWSGILDGSPTGTLNIPIPKYFNGTVRLIGIHVGDKKLSSTVATTISQDDFVIDPQVPYFVSPGDEFEVGATIANTVTGSGNGVQVKVSLAPSSGLEILEANSIELNVPENEDRSFRMKVRAKNAIGEQNFSIKAESLGRESSVDESLSVRPPQALRTTLKTGRYTATTGDPLGSLMVERDLYSEKREVLASISNSPLSIGGSLINYLKNYPYGCTEQVVSSAFPVVMFGSSNEMSLDTSDVDKYTKRAFQVLSSRQRADGSFGLWDANADSDLIFSAYATHFLFEARERSFEVPEEVFTRAESFLNNISNKVTYDKESQFAQGYALYLRARIGQNVSKDLKVFVENLNRQWKDDWKFTPISLFVAAAFKILQQDSEAEGLVKRPASINSRENWPYSDLTYYSSIYSFITAKHFSKEYWLSPVDSIGNLDLLFRDNNFNSFSAAFAVLGLHANSEKVGDENENNLSIKIIKDNAESALEVQGQKILKGLVPLGTSKVNFYGQNKVPFFYSLSETGFDEKDAPPFESGFSVQREIKNSQQQIVNEISLTDKLEVTIFIKTADFVKQAVILELLPGGFEIDLTENGLASRKSLGSGSNLWLPDFIDVQEDRLIFFGNLPADQTVKFTYRLKPLSRGKFVFPAPYGESLYDASLKAKGKASKIEIK